MNNAPTDKNSPRRTHTGQHKETCESLIDEHHQLLEKIDGLHRWWAEAAEIGSPKFEEMGDRVKV